MTNAGAVRGAEWVPLNAEQVVNLSGHFPIPDLVDEQADAIAANATADFKPTTKPRANWQNHHLYYPMPVLVDLGTPHQLEQIAFFDGIGSAPLRIEARVNNDWQLIAEDSLQRYQEWATIATSLSAQYLRITFTSPSAEITEFLVAGKTLTESLK